MNNWSKPYKKELKGLKVALSGKRFSWDGQQWGLEESCFLYKHCLTCPFDHVCVLLR